MKTFKFKSRYGETYEVKFVQAAYTYDGSLAIEVLNKAELFGSDFWEPYARLTVNLGRELFGKTAFLDQNNVPDLCEFVIDNGWAKQFGQAPSGFCIYPLVEFTDEFLNEICEVAV